MQEPAKIEDFASRHSSAGARKRRVSFVVSEGILDHLKQAQLRYSVPADSPTENFDSIIQGVRTGEFKMLDVFESGEKVGWTVYKICENEDGLEFLSVASHGKSLGGNDLSKAIIPILEGMAKHLGCGSIRLHTLRPGLVKKLSEGMGWFVSEFVMRKEIK